MTEKSKTNVKYFDLSIGITGHRDLTEVNVHDITLKMYEVVDSQAKRIVFGGARGADTIALVAAGEHKNRRLQEGTLERLPHLLVIVPATVQDQPEFARSSIFAYADEVIEMKGNPSVPKDYHRRNERIVANSDLLIAFWRGNLDGGTYNCVQTAKRCNIEVELGFVTEEPKATKGRK